MNKQNFNQQLDALPQELSPTKDLWRGIEQAITLAEVSRIQPKSSHKNAKLWLVAASVLLIFSVTFWQQDRFVSSQPLPIAQQMQQQFNQQQKLLLANYQQSAIQIPADIAQQLTVLNQAQQQLLQALATQPDNPQLLALLNYTQQQVLQLLTQVPQASYQQI